MKNITLLAKKAPSPRKPARPRYRLGWRLFQSLRRQDLILLAGVLSLACVSVLVLTFLILGRQSALQATPATVVAAPTPQHVVSYIQVTGLSQFNLAKDAAQQWAADAQLVSANASWPKIISRDQVGEPTPWTYRFYSPAKLRLFFVSVAPDGQLEPLEHVTPVTLSPQPISAAAWLIDSPTALALWLDNGGDKMVGENPGLEMMIQLRTLNDKPNPVWMVIGLNNQTEEVHNVVIDANQGSVTVTHAGS